MEIDFDKSLNKDEIEELYLKEVKGVREVKEVKETMTVIGRVYIREEPNTECDYVRILEPKELIIVHEIIDGVLS